MIEAKKVFEEFQKHRGDSIVHVQGTSGHHWNNISTKLNRDILLEDAMGQSTSAVFGLALGLPEEKVVHFDTEGALLMNLGVLASIAGKKPKNFVHFLLDNECYATTGGQPVPNNEEIDYAMIAKGAGYPITYNFTDLEGLLMNNINPPPPAPETFAASAPFLNPNFIRSSIILLVTFLDDFDFNAQLLFKESLIIFKSHLKNPSFIILASFFKSFKYFFELLRLDCSSITSDEHLDKPQKCSINELSNSHLNQSFIFILLTMVFFFSNSMKFKPPNDAAY